MSAVLLLDLVLERVREALDRDDAATEAYLFGSMARGDYSLWSDVDLLVVSKEPKRTRRLLRRVLDDLFVEHYITVASVVVDFESWKKGRVLLKKTIEREGRLVWRRG